MQKYVCEVASHDKLTVYQTIDGYPTKDVVALVGESVYGSSYTKVSVCLAKDALGELIKQLQEIHGNME